MPMLSVCLGCGEPTEGTRCGPCSAEHEQVIERPGTTARGYDNAWRRLSERARRLQRFCSDCGATSDLTVDHSPEAWRRRSRGLAVRLEDVEVVCRPCNGKRGRARPSDPRGGAPGEGCARPAGESDFESEIPHSGMMDMGGDQS